MTGFTKDTPISVMSAVRDIMTQNQDLYKQDAELQFTPSLLGQTADQQENTGDADGKAQ